MAHHPPRASPRPRAIAVHHQGPRRFRVPARLLETKGRFARNEPILVPNGVDYHAFAARRPEPDDLAGIPHPRVGYAGWFKDQLDGPLLIQLARAHPRWSFVFMGPQRSTPTTTPVLEVLQSLPNVHFLGPRLPDLLPAYVEHFDVGILPYRVTDYAKYIYPLKLHEYLAAGLPVVSARIRTVLDFSDVVCTAHTPEDWAHGREQALAPDARSPDCVAARQAVAREHDWSVVVG